MEPIRVLHEVTSMDTGGVETLLLNVYKNIDRSKIQFDFLMHREVGKSFYEEEIKKLGGRIYGGIPFNPLKHKEYIKSLDSFFKEHEGEYKIIHAHNAFSMYTLRSAKKYGIPVRIAHSHNGRPKLLHYKTPFKLYAKSKIKQVSTDLFACSEVAGEYYYGKKYYKNNPVVLVKNGIDTENFEFNEENRIKFRSMLQLDEKQKAIAHVGRFNIQKNHEFLIDVMKKVVDIDKDFVLFLFGGGDLKDKIEKKVERLGIGKNVRFMGVVGNVNEYLSAMDIFVLPSLFEGLPLTGIEAQANSLSCIFSDTITKEVGITDNAYFLPISNSTDEWASKIVELAKNGRNCKSQKEAIDNSGYNIKNTAKFLEEFYLKKYYEGE